MRTKKVLFISLLLIFILLTSGCLGGFFNKNKAPEIESAAVINATVGVEYTYKVIATDPDEDELTYSLTEKPNDMTITETGVVIWTPIEDGNYQVKVEVSDGKAAVYQKFTIIVAEALLKSIVVVPSEMSVYIGSSEIIDSITAYYDNETDAEIGLESDDVTYSSNHTNIATVSDSGEITGVSAGEAIITVSYTERYTEEDDITETDTITVTVPPNLSYIKVLPEFMNIFVESSQSITSIKAHYVGSTTPADIALNEASYAIDSPDTSDIITVNTSGVVTGVNASNNWQTITVTYTEGSITKTDTVYVKVEEAPPILDYISVFPLTMTLDEDESDDIITIRAYYINAPHEDLELDADGLIYSSDDEVIATVSVTGVITGEFAGTATITVAYTKDGITETDTVAVTVIE